MASDFLRDADMRYKAAAARRDQIEEQWSDLGQPLLAEGSTGQLVEHPLLKMLREHDLLVSKLAEVVRRRHAGPEPSAVLKAVGGLPPPLELKQARKR